MADYWGWIEIAARMQRAPSTLHRWVISRAFPVVRQRKPGRALAMRVWVYTNDEMITAWWLGQAAVQRRETIARREERRRVRAAARAQNADSEPTP